jgi:hypothetical protein
MIEKALFYVVEALKEITHGSRHEEIQPTPA